MQTVQPAPRALTPAGDLGTARLEYDPAGHPVIVVTLDPALFAADAPHGVSLHMLPTEAAHVATVLDDLAQEIR